MADNCKNDLEMCSVMILKSMTLAFDWSWLLGCYYETVSHAVLTNGELLQSALATTLGVFDFAQ